MVFCGYIPITHNLSSKIDKTLPIMKCTIHKTNNTRVNFEMNIKISQGKKQLCQLRANMPNFVEKKNEYNT